MRFVLFDDFRLGVLRDGQVIDVTGVLPDGHLDNPRALVRALIKVHGGAPQSINDLARGSNGLPLDSVRLRQPIPDPSQLLCAITNYKDRDEVPRADFFHKPAGSIVGPSDTIVLPPVSAQVFHAEPELAVVIKKTAANVRAADAMDYVFGYTGFLDVSARGAGPSFYLRKSYVTFGPPRASRAALYRYNDALRGICSKGIIWTPTPTIVCPGVRSSIASATGSAPRNSELTRFTCAGTAKPFRRHFARH